MASPASADSDGLGLSVIGKDPIDVRSADVIKGDVLVGEVHGVSDYLKRRFTR